MDAKEKSQIQEQLVRLYLRLNGYLSSGYIIHSDKHGKINGEIDVLAVRFPNNCEPEREITTDAVLHTSNTHIDFLICEVKSHKQSPHFNLSLRDDINNVHKILRWFGALTPSEIITHGAQVHALLQNGKTGTTKPSTCVINERNIQIRPLIFKPETISRRDEQPWFIKQPDIFSYISNCLKPEIRRSTCATRYDSTSWGSEYEPIVSFFKSDDYNDNLNMNNLYQYLQST